MQCSSRRLLGIAAVVWTGVTSCCSVIHDEGLAQRIASAAQASEAPIRMDKIAPFEWERLFVFEPYTPPETVERELGFSWSGSDHHRDGRRNRVARVRPKRKGREACQAAQVGSGLHRLPPRGWLPSNPGDLPAQEGQGGLASLLGCRITPVSLGRPTASRPLWVCGVLGEESFADRL